MARQNRHNKKNGSRQKTKQGHSWIVSCPYEDVDKTRVHVNFKAKTVTCPNGHRIVCR